MMKNRLQNQKGLTLIELLAVVVILGIVAAIAVPSIMNVIDNSKEDAVRSDAIQVLNAAKLYVAAEGLDSGDTINGSDLEGYVDGVTMESDVVITVGTKLTITGTITKGEKKIVLSGDDLEGIEGADVTEK